LQEVFFDTGFYSLWHRPLRRNPFIANAGIEQETAAAKINRTST
jgi:hypothetical protein